MAKKKYFKKKAVLKAISKYHRRKYNFICDVFFDNDNKIYIDGQESNNLIIGQLLTGNTSEFQYLGKQYGFVKCRGIALEAVTNQYPNSRYNAAVCLGQANDSLVFSNLRNQPNILLINSYGKSKAYFKISSEFTSTNDIQLFNNVALLPMAQGTSSLRYTLKITLYLTFKTNL